jgi:hypothetical protein
VTLGEPKISIISIEECLQQQLAECDTKQCQEYAQVSLVYGLMELITSSIHILITIKQKIIKFKIITILHSNKIIK